MKLQDQLHEILQDLSIVGSESILIVGATMILIIGLIKPNQWLIKGLFLALLVSSLVLNLQIEQGGLFLSDSLFLNKEIVSFESIFILFGALLLVFPRKHHVTEFYFFILALLVGSIFMMKANSLLIIYLSIELVSFVSYILTSFTFQKDGHEAGIKYLLFGALSSAILLIGLGLIYGSTETFYITEWNSAIFSDLLPQIGALFLVFGLFFKCAIFPFHIWTPATYQSGPIDAIALFSIVPKLAGLILLKRVYFSMAIGYTHWFTILILSLGILNILIGTLGALKQTNTRRMISFGSIAYSGFLLGLIFTPVDSYQDTFWFYAVVYGLMNVTVFFLIGQYESQSIHTNEQYVSTRNQVSMAVVLTTVMVSLVGIPPVAGFTAKLLLFSSFYEIFIDTGSTIAITYLLVSVFATVASLFFYLRVPFYVFLSKPKNMNAELSIVFSRRSKILATILGITLLLLFFVPKMVLSLQSLLNNVNE